MKPLAHKGHTETICFDVFIRNKDIKGRGQAQMRINNTLLHFT